MTGTQVEASVGPSGTTSGNAEQVDNGSVRLNDGASITLGNTLDLSPRSAMTICMWVSLLQDHPGQWHLLATKWNDNGPTNDKYQFQFGLQDSVLNLLWSADGETFQTITQGGSLLAEHGVVHCCFTANSATRSAQLYMNGVPVGQPGVIGSSAFPQTSQPIMIGCKSGIAATRSVCLDSFLLVENHDCGGQDIETLIVEWDDQMDLEHCAARCEQLAECSHFNFGHAGSERGQNEECNLKRAFAEGPAPACGGTSATWDVWELQGRDPGCAGTTCGDFVVDEFRMWSRALSETEIYRGVCKYTIILWLREIPRSFLTDCL
jgi:hypothetical protein